MAANDSDDEPLVLSGDTLSALKEFYAERDAHTEKFAALKNAAEEKHAASGAAQQPLSMDIFTEDWNESQFWYSDSTATTLAEQLLHNCTSSTQIAIVSAPSVFVALKNLVAKLPEGERPAKMVLLEHDERFAVFGGEFVFYDFAQPVRLPAELKGCMDRVICDPPFLSEDCQTKAALTVRWLSKPIPKTPAPDSDASTRLIVCTGERMSDLITNKVYKAQGVRTTNFEVVHSRGLSNEFRCYANFTCDEWDWRDDDGDGVADEKSS